MKMIPAGERRHQLTIEQNSSTDRDAYGQKSKSWTTFASTWGKLEPLSPRDLPIARGFKDTTSHQATIRYRPGVLTTMRVAFGARHFSIDGIVNVEERNIDLILYCTEIVGTPQELS